MKRPGRRGGVSAKQPASKAVGLHWQQQLLQAKQVSYAAFISLPRRANQCRALAPPVVLGCVLASHASHWEWCKPPLPPLRACTPAGPMQCATHTHVRQPPRWQWPLAHCASARQMEPSGLRSRHLNSEVTSQYWPGAQWSPEPHSWQNRPVRGEQRGNWGGGSEEKKGFKGYFKGWGVQAYTPIHGSCAELGRRDRDRCESRTHSPTQ